MGSAFQDKLKALHNRMEDVAGEEITYIKAGTKITVKAVPVHYPGEVANNIPMRTERQVFYVRQSELAIEGVCFKPAIHDTIIWKNETYKVVSPVAEINPKSNDSPYDYTTSDRDVVKIETLRFAR